MNIDKIIEILTKGQNEEKAEGFVKFLAEKLWNSYNDYLMDKVLVVENEIKSLQIVLPNAKEYQPYDYEVKAPHDNMVIQSVTGLEKDIHGLTISDSMPESNYELTIKYVYKGLELPDDRPVLERKISLIINQDPRNLWKNMDVDWDNMPEPKYIKEHTQVDYVKVPALEDGTPQKDIVAASKRGRSHAQEGKPRDDHFKLYHDDKTNWYVIAVADGAGSAKFSREGSRIACDTVIDYCKSQLENCEDFEEHINTYNEYKNDSESDARKLVGDYI